MINKKNRYYIFLIILLVSFFLQITFFSQMFAVGYIPNIVLIILIAFSVACRSENVLYFAFVIGIILDIVSISYFGSATISMVSTIFLVLYLRPVVLKYTLSYYLLVISFAGVLVYNILYVVLININNFYVLVSNAGEISLIILFQVIIALVLIYPITNLFSCKNEK